MLALLKMKELKHTYKYEISSRSLYKCENT